LTSFRCKLAIGLILKIDSAEYQLINENIQIKDKEDELHLKQEE